MRCAMFSACVVLSLAVAGYTEGQGKKKLPALAYDAVVVKLDEKKGFLTTIYYETSPEDKKALGIGSSDAKITKSTKFIFVGPAGEKNFNQRSVLADPEVKQHLQKDSKFRVQTTAVEAEEIRFGPELKSQPPKRVR